MKLQRNRGASAVYSSLELLLVDFAVREMHLTVQLSWLVFVILYLRPRLCSVFQHLLGISQESLVHNYVLLAFDVCIVDVFNASVITTMS